MVLAISAFVSGFIMKAEMPAALAFSESTLWLKPVQRMTGMSAFNESKIGRAHV